MAPLVSYANTPAAFDRPALAVGEVSGGAAATYVFVSARRRHCAVSRRLRRSLAAGMTHGGARWALLTVVWPSLAERARMEWRKGFAAVLQTRCARYREERRSGRRRFARTESSLELRPWRGGGMWPNTLTRAAERGRTG